MKTGRMFSWIMMLTHLLTTSLTPILEFFMHAFQLEKKNEHKTLKPWLTTGIRISCANKRKIYATYRISNNSNYKTYYKNYCKILSSLIITAKKKNVFWQTTTEIKQPVLWPLIWIRHTGCLMLGTLSGKNC